MLLYYSWLGWPIREWASVFANTTYSWLGRNIYHEWHVCRLLYHLSLCVLTLLAKGSCEIHHAAERAWVIIPEHRLLEMQRLLGLCVFALLAKRRCETHHAAERAWVILPEHRLLEMRDAKTQHLYAVHPTNLQLSFESLQSQN